MRRQLILVMVVVVSLVSSASTSFGVVASFQGLGDLPGGDFLSDAREN